jgi:hypothetical protein
MSRLNLLAATTFAGIGLGLRPAATAPAAPAAAVVPAAAPPSDSLAAANAAKAEKKKGTINAAGECECEDGEECDCDEPDSDSDADDDEGEMSASTPAGAARMREQARIAAILADPAAATRADSAMHLALNTRMPRADAIALLATLPKGGASRSRLDTEMAALKAPGAGAAPASASDKAAAGWEGAFKKHAVAITHKSGK